MNNLENIKSREKLNIEQVEDLIYGDYPQHSALYVLNHLLMVADGDWDEEEFFQKTKLEFIKDVDQYFDKYCEARSLDLPDELSQNILELKKIIDNLVLELKEVIIKRDNLSKIYNIVRRFETEAGIKSETIPFFEKQDI